MQEAEEVVTSEEEPAVVEQAETVEAEATEETPEQQAEAPADEVVVTIGDEQPTQEDDFDGKPAPEWVKKLRHDYKEAKRQLRELESKQQPPKVDELGPKPTLEAHDWDAEAFEKALEGWHDRKRAIDEQAKAKADAERKANEKWQATVESYAKAKVEIQAKVRDFDDAEAAVKDAFSVTQQGILLEAAESSKSSALMVAALGANQAKLKELAAIESPVKFAAAIAKLEDKLKVTPKKVVPPPERVVRGSAPSGTFGAAQLEKLKEKARETGNYEEYFREKNRLQK